LAFPIQALKGSMFAISCSIAIRLVVSLAHPVPAAIPRGGSGPTRCRALFNPAAIERLFSAEFDRSRSLLTKRLNISNPTMFGPVLRLKNG
jgi:hypothetical protein